jgi:exodeoxyribonuclease-3
LKIATFNINNINKRLHNLTSWLARAQPDVVCLQEPKVEQRAFPASALRDLGYRGSWLGERSWNGVAILARECDPVLTRSSLPGNPQDRQARYIEAAVNGVLIASIYLPNGNPQPGPKFDYKLAWLERLIEHGAELMKAGVPVVLAGDYNVVPTMQDIYPTRSLDNNALIQPQSRQAYARLLAVYGEFLSQAAIGVSYKPRQCDRQRYESRPIGDVPSPVAGSGNRPSSPACVRYPL